MMPTRRSEMSVGGEVRYGQNYLQLPQELQAEFDAFSEEHGDIPEGIGFIGGMARRTAFKVLRGADVGVRDVDAVAFPELGPELSFEEKNRWSAELMPDDYAHGHGIKSEESIAAYFDSRDITMNQVLVAREGGKWGLYYSAQAAIDIRQGAIRPTIMEYNDNRYFGQKLIVKSILLEQVLQRDGISDAHIAGIDLRRTIGDDGLSNFMVSLGLQKSFEWGGDMPERYAAALRWYEEGKRLPVSKAGHAVLETAERAARAGFYFRKETEEKLQQRRARAETATSVLRFTVG